jgi:hypothetical protein
MEGHLGSRRGGLLADLRRLSAVARPIEQHRADEQHDQDRARNIESVHPPPLRRGASRPCMLSRPA